jgi:hypothetical protein
MGDGESMSVLLRWLRRIPGRVEFRVVVDGGVEMSIVIELVGNCAIVVREGGSVAEFIHRVELALESAKVAGLVRS